MSKIIGKDGTFKIDGSTHAVFDLSINTSAGEVDVTDFESAGNYKEFLAGLKDGELSFNFYLDDSVIPVKAGSSIAWQAIFGAYSISGDAVVTQRNITSAVEDAVKVSVTARITGEPVEAA